MYCHSEERSDEESAVFLEPIVSENSLRQRGH